MRSPMTLASIPTSHRRPIRPILIVVAAVALAIASFGWMPLTGRQPLATPMAPPVGVPVADVDPLQPLADIDSAIAVWTGNLERDGDDFIAATQLAQLYLGRARLSADPADLDRALDASARALEANADLVAARLLQAQVRLARHDFNSARADALAILAAHPGLAQAVATLGDAELELGAYDEAATNYTQLAAAAAGPAVLARQARLASITGDLAGARRLAADALAGALDQPDISATELAWYHTLAASLAFQAGDLSAADAAYTDAIDAWPASAAALAGLGRTRAASGEIDGAIELYQRSVAIVPNLEARATLGDLLARAGRLEERDAAYAQVRAAAALAAASGLSDRQWALFLANHGEDPAQAVEVAAGDLERRGDVHAHDAYAWALFAAGRFVEADAAIGAARAQSTEDALIDYHAGMIAAALGRDAEARTLLTAALARNSGFDLLQADRAAAALAALETNQ
jgi:tetratricopeptide (TPR) repeat protein